MCIVILAAVVESSCGIWGACCKTEPVYVSNVLLCGYFSGPAALARNVEDGVWDGLHAVLFSSSINLHDARI
jgi:hypothetical protein